MRTQRCVVGSVSQWTAALLLAVTMVAAGWAQDLPSSPSAQPAGPSSLPFDVKRYEKPMSYFPNPLGPYTSRDVAQPNSANSPRLDRLMRDGKLYISLEDAIALALENNLDLEIARYNLNIADTDIWRAKAGSSISGVASGIVQNTPGGGAGGLGTQVGSGQGGTSVAAGGAGAGAGGIVSSTLGAGPPVSSFDPTLTGSIVLDHFYNTCNTPFCATNQNTTSGNFSYTQGFQWGTDMSIGFNNSRVASNSVYTFLSPALSSSFQFKLTQHLLQGFGFTSNTRYIKIAKNNREISDVAFQLQIITTADQIENMYWDLVYAYENVKVQKEQMAFAQKTLANNQAGVEIGSVAPIEVVRAQSMIATDQQALTLALTNLELSQLLMKNAITRTLDDPVLMDAEVIPTSPLEKPSQESIVPTQDLVNEALGHRPELAEARINLVNAEISNKAVRNGLLPSLDLSAYYGGAALGGNTNAGSICVSEPLSCGFRRPPSQLNSSYGATLQQLVNSTAPDKGVTVSLSIPLRNRSAQATQVRSQLEYRQAQLRVQQLENLIRIEVRNAQFGVQQNRASVAAAQSALDLARQALESEQKKFDIRASTAILVLQNEAAFIQAQATLLSAKIAYQKAEVELDRAVGLLLAHSGVLLGDAERGQVTHEPNISHISHGPTDEQKPTGQPPQPQR